MTVSDSRAALWEALSRHPGGVCAPGSSICLPGMFTNNAGIITLRAAPAQHIHFKTNSTSRYTPRLGRGSSDSNANAHTWSCWQYRELQLPTGCAIWCGRHNLERGEREKRGKAHKFITSGSTVTLPGFFRGASAFLSRHTPLNLQRFTTKGYFL